MDDKDNTESKSEPTADEYLDRLCYLIGAKGADFYPPDETAQTCIDGIEDDDALEIDDFVRGKEHGLHTERWLVAMDLFDDLEAHGFDPVKRAEREIDRSVERHGFDRVEIEIDWSWWEDHK